MNEDLRQKIQLLCDYRQFPLLYTFADDGFNLPIFEQKLHDLQAKIYYLDTHLEENWNVDFKKIEACWNDIYQALNSLSIPQEKYSDYVKHIKMYQRHELQLREKKWPCRLDQEYYYYYKSCDVKLLRRLIFENIPSLKKEFSLSDWRWFDLITEVNDDATDIFEDKATINGNSILISIKLHGIEKTKDDFFAFIDTIAAKMEKNRKSKTKTQNLIYDLTVNNIFETKSVLSNNLSNFTFQDDAETAIFKYI